MLAENNPELPPVETEQEINQVVPKKHRGPGKNTKPVVIKEAKVKKTADPEYYKKYYIEHQQKIKDYEKSRNDVHAYCDLCASEVVRKHLQRHNRSKGHTRILEVMELKKKIDEVTAEFHKHRNENKIL
jgi:hypothetical protein